MYLPVAAFLACTTPSPTPEPSLRTPPLTEAYDIPAKVADPTSALLLSLAAGKASLESILDEKRGFVLVEFRGAHSDNAEERFAERVCGDNARQHLDVLFTDVAERTQNGSADVFSCDGPVCTHPAAHEDDWSGSYAFQAPEGRQVLGVVVRMGYAPKERARRQAVEEWVDAELQRLTGEDCKL